METRVLVAAFFATQIAMAVSLLLFRVLEKRLSLSPRIFLRLAQLFLVLSLVLPSGALWWRIKSTPLTEVPTPLFSETMGQRVLQLSSAKKLSRGQSESQSFSEARGLAQTSALRRVTWADLLFFTWLVFGAPFLLMRLVGIVRLVPVLRRADLLRRVGRVQIYVSDFSGVPFCFSWFGQSRVVIPSALLSHPVDLKLALMHELQHLRTRDPAQSYFLDLLVPVFGPLLWLWRTQVTELQELSCDQAVLSRRGVRVEDYVGCLLRVAESVLAQKQMSALSLAGTAWLGGRHRDPNQKKLFLRRRIESMFLEKTVSQWSKIGTRSLAALFCGVVSVVATSYSAAAALKPSQLPAINSGTFESDPAILKIAEDELKKAVTEYRAREAFAIVAEPSTGRILAIAQAMNEARAARVGMQTAGLWPIQNLVEPAAALKPLLLAKGLESHTLALEEQFDCEHGNYRVGNRIHHDHSSGFGILNSRQIVSKSSNIGGIKFAEKLGQATLSQLLSEFGIGQGGSVQDFPGARVGYVLNPSQLNDPGQWLPLVAAGFGSIYVNPLELVQSYSAFANGGLLMKAIPFDADLNEVTELKRVLSPENAWKMKQVLFESATTGTGGNNGVSTLYTSGGKTGTNYSPRTPQHDSAFGGDENVAHYVGFSPLQDPKITVYVGVINPKDRLVVGSRHAAPVFKRISERVLQHMGVKPDQPRVDQ